MAALGPTTAAFRPLLRRFWRLVPALQAEFSRFEREVLRPTSQPPTHIVALQVRAVHFVRPRSEEATFYRCAQQLGNLAGMGLGGERGQAWGARGRPWRLPSCPRGTSRGLPPRRCRALPAVRRCQAVARAAAVGQRWGAGGSGRRLPPPQGGVLLPCILLFEPQAHKETLCFPLCKFVLPTASQKDQNLEICKKRVERLQKKKGFGNCPVGPWGAQAGRGPNFCGTSSSQLLARGVCRPYSLWLVLC